jgi:hypothetical protein
MSAGLAELDRWLRDQVRVGLAGTERAGYGPFDTLAARMVDAQLPGVASAVRRLASAAASGDGWPGRLLEEYALLHLLVAAAQPEPYAEAVRGHLGVPVAKDDVLAREPVRDRWAVLAVRDEAEDRFVVRRVWLRGEETGRSAVVLSFSATPQQPLDASLVPGTVLDADVHYYPGAAPLRALVGTRHSGARRRPPGEIPGVGLDGALAAWSGVLAVDPWVRAWPVVLAGVVPVVDGEGWWLVDDAGALPLLSSGEPPWPLLAVSGGHPVTVLAEIVPGGVRTIVVLDVAQAPAGVPR